MTLYELKGQYKELYAMLEDEEITPEAVLDTLEAIDGEIEDKAVGYAMVMQQLKGEIEVSKAEEARLAENRRRKQAHIDRMMEYLSKSLLEVERREITTPLFRFSFRKSESVEIDDMDKIPFEYMKYEPKPDKTAIKKALKEAAANGESVDYAHIEVKQNLQIK